MQSEQYSIGKGPSECFLVFDKALGMNAEFYDYLRKEGFSLAYPNPGDAASKHCYVNITRRQYANGKAGVRLCQPIGNTSITIAEFKAIWDIYKRHQGKGECFSHEDVPYLYQSPTVIRKRREYEKEQRRLKEMRKKRVPATPAEVEALVKEFPYSELTIRSLAAKGETKEAIRYMAEIEW